MPRCFERGAFLASMAKTSPAMTNRRLELGDFLRRRRASVTPAMVDMPLARRRRTPGLRREEVAELAGISVSLYTWLEQGRPVSVSRRNVDAVMAALRCGPVERDYARALARELPVGRHEAITRFAASRIHSESIPSSPLIAAGISCSAIGRQKPLSSHSFPSPRAKI